MSDDAWALLFIQNPIGLALKSFLEFSKCNPTMNVTRIEISGTGFLGRCKTQVGLSGIRDLNQTEFFYIDCNLFAVDVVQK